MRLTALWMLLTLLASSGLGCGDDESSGPGGGGNGVGGGADLPAGETAIVAIVNPVVNDDNQSTVPGELGNDREGIDVDAEPGESDITEDGIAVVGVPTGAVDVNVGLAPSLSHNVVAEGDIYDAAIGYDGSGAAFFEFTPIRYAVGDQDFIDVFDEGDDIGDIDARLDADDSIVVLRSGRYVGNLEITGGNIILFGEGWSDRSVVIEGSISARGEGVRVRGLTVTGDVSATGNNFGISFSLIQGTIDITGNAGAYLRNVFCGSANVPSSSATLLDNWGIAPQVTLDPAREELCQP